MRHWLFLASLLTLHVTATSNPAMPGVWNAGVGGQLYPLFAEDSVRFGKVLLEKELVLVNLYPGFAVVKGEYRFLNNSGSTVRLRVGYPVSGTYTAVVVDNVVYNDLYAFRAFANGIPVQARRNSDAGTVSPVRLITDSSAVNQVTNWYTWEQDFPQGEYTTLTIYFITQNNLARFKRGNLSRDGNAFGYVLESGQAWGGRIGVGQVLIRLHEGLSVNNVMGILPAQHIVGDLTHIQYSFKNLAPEPSDNLLVWYEGAPPDFKFEKRVLPAADTLFKMMDAFPVSEFNNTGFRALDRNNFSLAESGLTFSGALYFILFTIPWIVLGGFIIYLVRGKKKKMNKTA